MIISDSFKLGLLIFTLNLSPVWAQNFTQIVLPGDNGWTEGGNWIDYDDDGDLDLFLPNNRRSPAVVTWQDNLSKILRPNGAQSECKYQQAQFETI